MLTCVRAEPPKCRLSISGSPKTLRSMHWSASTARWSLEIFWWECREARTKPYTWTCSALKPHSGKLEACRVRDRYGSSCHPYESLIHAQAPHLTISNRFFLGLHGDTAVAPDTVGACFSSRRPGVSCRSAPRASNRERWLLPE